MATKHKESVLSCASVHEAQNVIDSLFDKQLIVRAEILPSSLENEVKIILENAMDNIEELKREIVALLGSDKGLVEI